jgi:hypothetical protein
VVALLRVLNRSELWLRALSLEQKEAP